MHTHENDPMAQALEMAHLAQELNDAFAQKAQEQQNESRFDAFDAQLAQTEGAQ